MLYNKKKVLFKKKKKKNIALCKGEFHLEHGCVWKSAADLHVTIQSKLKPIQASVKPIQASVEHKALPGWENLLNAAKSCYIQERPVIELKGGAGLKRLLE